jgi:hypothetical protein
MRMSKQQQEEILRRYQNGESSEMLARVYGISGAAVRALLKRRGIEGRSRELAARKYSCDHGFFSSINSEEKAYWLGFIAADGNIHDNCLGVFLSAVDRDHLVLLAASLHSSHPVVDYTQEGYAYSRFRIFSTELTEDLKSLGIAPRKTFTLQWPALSAAMLRHYARGYVDGDGCFSINSKSRNNANVYFSVTSNKPFLLDMQAYLMEHCALRQTELYQRHKDSPIYSMRYTGKLQIRRIVDFLYCEATFYLPRKYEQAYSITR